MERETERKKTEKVVDTRGIKKDRDRDRQTKLSAAT